MLGRLAFADRLQGWRSAAGPREPVDGSLRCLTGDSVGHGERMEIDRAADAAERLLPVPRACGVRCLLQVADHRHRSTGRSPGYAVPGHLREFLSLVDDDVAIDPLAVLEGPLSDRGRETSREGIADRELGHALLELVRGPRARRDVVAEHMRGLVEQRDVVNAPVGRDD